MSQPVTFVSRAEALIGTHEAEAIGHGVRNFLEGRDRVVAEFGLMEDLRDRARVIRLHALENLDRLLARFSDQLEAAGGQVHWAGDAAEAREIVAGILETSGARLVAKSKSMVSEEIELNAHLEPLGHEVVETDLGEFIAQLAGDVPSHIIAPVMHMTREDVGRLFADRLGVPYTDDAIELNRIARQHLREVFLRADAGISGVNMAVADSGSIVIVTNEGNGRLVSTAPRLHIALMGMERIVATWEDAAVILETLARSATGQHLSTYTNVITGPRKEFDPDGPEELHVVVVDNGRSGILAGETAEILACIRCGACLNVCPVFRTVGGHGYGTVYSGPMGAIVTPGLHGMDPWWDLPYASTLCGACVEVCPVRIEIPRMLLHLRQQAASEGRLPGWLNRGVSIYARSAVDPSRWDRAKRWSRRLTGPFARGGWIRRLPGPGRGWTTSRDLRRPAKESFNQWWRSSRGP
ncbi:MAG TPA: LutB/LldF family L-lactate oxidation iron-sulfur protein [Acidimicrobiia bacterium]|nr:LutB/LldF family L-lactate oxidation iron-sulfur protein [Acidimicrobiia bacterium]